jgi:hypothetical protein
MFRDMLQNTFWVASSTAPGSASNPWLQINPEAFSNLWTSPLANNFIQDSSEVIGAFD